jgi:hypothetical protein
MAVDTHPRRRAAVVGSSRSERNPIHRIEPYGARGQPKVNSYPNRPSDGPADEGLLPQAFVSLKRFITVIRAKESRHVLVYGRVADFLFLKRLEGQHAKVLFRYEGWCPDERQGRD